MTAIEVVVAAAAVLGSIFIGIVLIGVVATLAFHVAGRILERLGL